MKIVINQSYGGYGLSPAAMIKYFELSNIKYTTNVVEEYKWQHFYVNDADFFDFDIDRDDRILVQVVEELGKLSWGSYSELKVVEVPDGVNWQIDDYDGREWVAETHRTWE